MFWSQNVFIFLGGNREYTLKDLRQLKKSKQFVRST